MEEQLVPALRFKDENGQDFPDWEIKKLNQISYMIKRKSKSDIKDVLTISSKVGFVNQNDRFSRIIAGESLEKYTLLYRNEFSYNRGNSKSFQFGCIYKLSNYAAALVPNVYRSFGLNEGIPDYYQQLFLSKYLDRQLKRLISSSARMDGLLNIGQNEFYECKVVVPNIKEQQKIADFLSSVDKKIEQLTRKKELLEKYKTGIMQKLFPKAGEQHPELRFKDENGQDFPDWELKSIGELGETYNGLNGKTKEDFGSGHPFITYKQIFDSSAIDSNRFDYVMISDGENQNKVQKGDIFFTTSSETRLEVGFTSVLLDSIENLYLNSFCFGYRVYEKHIYLTSFFRFYFRSPSIRFKIARLGQGSTRYNLSKNELKKIILRIPSTPEQQKIADFLSAIDDKITKVEGKLTKAQTFKKGLLQQMFV